MQNGTQLIQISNAEFELFRSLFYDVIGLNLSEQKKLLLTGRLGKRLAALGLPSFKAYYELITSPAGESERQFAVDLITTHETYFFREPQHFEILRDYVLPLNRGNRTLRIWSAACSSGEEAYSIAMLLHDCRGKLGWELVASDVSIQVINRARQGLYLREQARIMPVDYLKRYCLRGTGQYDGYLLVERMIRESVDFREINLMRVPRDVGTFDVIFLRNVAIYFDPPTQSKVLEMIAQALNPDGWLFLGHSESLLGGEHDLTQVAPSVYRKQKEAQKLVLNRQRDELQVKNHSVHQAN